MYNYDDDDWIEPEEIIRDEDDSLSSSLTISTEALPKTLYILPLSERPFFPAQTLPILMAEDPWLDTIKKIGETKAQVGGVLLVRHEEEDGLLLKASSVSAWLNGSPMNLLIWPRSSTQTTPTLRTRIRPKPMPWRLSTP